MKTFIHNSKKIGKLALIVNAFLLPFFGSSQVTNPIIKANFGVDGDLRANIFNTAIQPGNDDWYSDGTAGAGKAVIDTNGAAAIVSRYSSDLSFRGSAFFRKMAIPQYSAINGSLWLDGLMVRDHFGNDSTGFLGTNKNGYNPRKWNGGTKNILDLPDKNDIGDIFAHLRRAGTNLTDSLWFMGGITLMGNVGNRYFDFELYQSDLTWDHSSGKFLNYGSDSGHVAWQFDALGNVVRPGDIIFTAEYSSTGLTFIEARIWIRGADTLTVSPTRFNWASGKYSGQSYDSIGITYPPTFGYKAIVPETSGDYYTGTQSSGGIWAGPFGFIDRNNVYNTTYATRQFMEISVNLTKLGLDPIDLLGSGNCNMPFSKIIVKTRASTDIDSELKDFVGPFSLFGPARVDMATNLPFLCDSVSHGELWVANPLSTSIYTWSTNDGNIVGSNTGTSINVSKPGNYVVQQRLYTGCIPYASDTIAIGSNGYHCTYLSSSDIELQGQQRNNTADLRWGTKGNGQYAYFDLERSVDGQNFQLIKRITASSNSVATYTEKDHLSDISGSSVIYRVRIYMKNGMVNYTKEVRMQVGIIADFLISPNPVQGLATVSIQSDSNEKTLFQIIDVSGKIIKQQSIMLKKGFNFIHIDLYCYQRGLYQIIINCNGVIKSEKLILQ
jgi:hypothetical protein